MGCLSRLFRICADGSRADADPNPDYELAVHLAGWNAESVQLSALPTYSSKWRFRVADHYGITKGMMCRREETPQKIPVAFPREV